MEKHKVLDQLLLELHRFLLTLDKENLSGKATVQKGLLSDLLKSYTASNGGDEEYIYMNKVTVTGKGKTHKDEPSEELANGKAGKHVPAPQKSLPDLPPPRTGLVSREPFPLPPTPAPASAPATAFLESGEGYYEEAQPYEEALNDDGEAVSSSYESYDEEEVTKGKSSSHAQHQWPSTEASIELMKDARICAFLWRKKWLGQWAKQLCVIKDHRLLCYKSSKEQMPLLDVSLLGCSVVYKEKQLKRKEHKLKIVPLGGEAIVLGLQSKEQTELWLKVILDISPRQADSCDNPHSVSDSPRLICTKGELSERHSVASESGSSTDSHADTPEGKDVKKKYGAGLKFSNIMNIGKKKPSSLESPEKCVDTSGYLNVLVNSQWRTRWCLIKNSQLCFYLDKGKNKVSQPALALEGCSVTPDPSPEHLYSFSISLDGTQLATLEAKSSADMGHWLGLLLSQTGTKTDPEELTYDYVNSERISSIVNAAKTSLYLMQRRYSEPNTYIDSLPSIPHTEDLYDDVASIEADSEKYTEDIDTLDSEKISLEESAELCAKDEKTVTSAELDTADRVYLDLIPLRSFLHTSSGPKPSLPLRDPPGPPPAPTEGQTDAPSPIKELESTSRVDQSETESPPTENDTCPTAASSRPEQPPPPSPGPLHVQAQAPAQKNAPLDQDSKNKTSAGLTSPQGSNPSGAQSNKPLQSLAGLALTPQSPQRPQSPRARSTSNGDKPKFLSIGCPGAIEVKLGKNRTEADMRRYTDERDRLEKEREEVKSRLASLKKERREMKEELGSCQDPGQQASLEAGLKQKEEACREAEHRRVEVELLLMEVKESLRKAEAGPFTLGTTLDSSLQDTPLFKVTTPSAPSQHPPSQTSSPSPVDQSSPVNSATALKNRPASIMGGSKGNVLQKAKEWEKKSTN